MTQHAEPHHDPRFDDPRAEADDNWTPPELPDQMHQTPLDQQPDPERADWMPPPEHRPPSLLGEDGARDQQAPVRHDPTATMLPPTDPTAGTPPIPPPSAMTPAAPAPGGPMAAAPGAGGTGTIGASRAAGMAPSAGTATADPLWPDAEVARFEGRWRDVQLGFVDDPRHAADEAGSLLDEVVDRLMQAIGDRRRELDTWRDGNGAGNGGDDTESMLSAVRRYRRLMDQLLAMGGHPR